MYSTRASSVGSHQLSPDVAKNLSKAGAQSARMKKKQQQETRRPERSSSNAISSASEYSAHSPRMVPRVVTSPPRKRELKGPKTRELYVSAVDEAELVASPEELQHLVASGRISKAQMKETQQMQGEQQERRQSRQLAAGKTGTSVSSSAVAVSAAAAAAAGDPDRSKRHKQSEPATAERCGAGHATEEVRAHKTVKASGIVSGRELANGTYPSSSSSPSSLPSPPLLATSSHAVGASGGASSASAAARLKLQQQQLELEQERAEVAAERHRQHIAVQKQQQAAEEERAAREILTLRAQLEEQRVVALAEAHAQTQKEHTVAAVERDARQLLAGLRAEKDVEWQSKYQELSKLYNSASAERDVAVAERDALARQLEDAHNREASTRCVLGGMVGRRVDRRLMAAAIEALWSAVVKRRLLGRAERQQGHRRMHASFGGWRVASQCQQRAMLLRRRCGRHNVRSCWQVWESRLRARNQEDWHARLASLHTNMVGELLRQRYARHSELCFSTWKTRTILRRRLRRHLARTDTGRLSEGFRQWRESIRLWKRSQRVSMQMLRMPLARALRGWRQATVTKRTLRRISGTISDGYLRRVLSDCFLAWMRTTMLEKRHRRKCDTVMVRVYKVTLRRWFLRLVVAAHTRRRLRSIASRSRQRRHQRALGKLFAAWAEFAAARSLSSGRRERQRQLHDLGLDAGGMFQGGEVAVMAKALAQKARLETLVASVPDPGFGPMASARMGFQGDYGGTERHSTHEGDGGEEGGMRAREPDWYVHSRSLPLMQESIY